MLGLYGGKCDLESPENVCGAGYWGKRYRFYSSLIFESKIFSGVCSKSTPILYNDCRCNDGQCFAVVFKPSEGLILEDERGLLCRTKSPNK